MKHYNKTHCFHHTGEFHTAILENLKDDQDWEKAAKILEQSLLNVSRLFLYVFSFPPHKEQERLVTYISCICSILFEKAEQERLTTNRNWKPL